MPVLLSFLVFAYCAISAAHAQSDKILDVKTHFYGGGTYALAIQGHSDRVTIFDVKVNHGNCAIRSVDPRIKLPVVLKFGEVYEVGFFNTMGGCRPIEIIVSTRWGDLTFTPTGN